MAAMKQARVRKPPPQDHAQGGEGLGQYPDAGGGAQAEDQLAILADLQQAAHDGAGAQELTDDAHEHQNHGVTHALEDAVQSGGADGVLVGEGLGAAQDDAVDHDLGG